MTPGESANAAVAAISASVAFSIAANAAFGRLFRGCRGSVELYLRIRHSL